MEIKTMTETKLIPETKAKIKTAIDYKAVKMINIIKENFTFDPDKPLDESPSSYQNVIEKKEGKRQFIDLIEASSQACCIDEFKLYIEYKGSKEGTKKVWAGYAKIFNEVIKELMDEIADKIVEELKQATVEVDTEIVRLEVLQRFCGYLMWHASADFSRKHK